MVRRCEEAFAMRQISAHDWRKVFALLDTALDCRHRNAPRGSHARRISRIKSALHKCWRSKSARRQAISCGSCRSSP